MGCLIYSYPIRGLNPYLSMQPLVLRSALKPYVRLQRDFVSPNDVGLNDKLFLNQNINTFLSI